MKKRRVCLTKSSYNLFLYYLINGLNDNDIIICTHLVPEEVKNNINHIDLPFVTFIDGPKMAPTNTIKGIFENIIGYCRYFYGYLKLRILLFFKCFNKDVEVWGQPHTPFSYIFYTYKNANMIEHGLTNYQLEPIEPHKINPFLDLILHICGIYFLDIRETLGTHENIKKIYLTRPSPFESVKDKVVIFNLHQLWNEKSPEEKEKILKIFNVDTDIIKNIDENYKLLLTQTFSEDNLLPYEEEISIYYNLVGNTEKLIVKPHPNEKKDHSKIFPSAIIINKEFPIELMELIGINVKDVYSINSTSLLNFKNANIHIFEGKTSSKYVNDSIIQLSDMINK